MHKMSSKKVSCCPTSTILVGVFIMGACIGLGLAMDQRKDSKSYDKNTYKSASRLFKHAAVVADSTIAAEIGNYILKDKQGNAVDAAVATIMATCVISPHSCGLGGGSFFVIYDKEYGWHAFDSRETAPLAATEDMFMAPENKNKSIFGGLAIGVPGEVKGLYEVQNIFGKVSWSDVVMPTIDLCEKGVPISCVLHKILANLQTQELKNMFNEYFDDNYNVKPVGTPIKLPRLTKTFQAIAYDPLDFYFGELAEDIVADIKDVGGIITIEDLNNYIVKWKTPSVLNLPGNLSVHSIPPPGSGPVLGYILNILSGYNFSPASIADDAASILTHHRIVEAMKFAYGKRGELGDEDFVDVTEDVKKILSLAYGEQIRKRINDTHTQETNYYNPAYYMNNDHGTAHVSVVDSQGNAVSVTSTINTHFGCLVKGKRTGIIFNSEMDDFSTPNAINFFHLPASPANYIKPEKRPMSSMCPAIVFDNGAGKVKMVTGASGGSRITSAVALNIIDVMWLGLPLPSSIDRPRFHHQLIPAEIAVEDSYPENILNGLKAKGHTIGNILFQPIIQAISVLENGILAVSDYRQGEVPGGY